MPADAKTDDALVRLPDPSDPEQQKIAEYGVDLASGESLFDMAHADDRRQ